MKVKKSECAQDHFTGIIEYCDGTDYAFGPQVRHYKNGTFHNENGPAIEYTDGSKFWLLEGVHYGSEKYWKIEVEKLKQSRIKSK
jgi:hypothetical protein